MKSLALRFLLPFGFLAAVFSAFVLYRAYVVSQRHAHELLNRQAALAMEFNLAIRDYAAAQIRPVMERLVDKDEFLPETMSTSFISRNIFERVREKFPECVIHFASDNPRNPVNQASPDEVRMIAYFRQHPQAEPRTEEIRIESRRYLAYFVPKWMKPECLRCHGDPKDAPAALIKRYGATASFHRKVGDVVALDTVAVPLDVLNVALAAEMRWQSLILAAGLALLLGAVMVVFRFVVPRRLAAMASHFHEIAAQPESTRLKLLEVGGKDEIGLVGAAFNKLVEHLRQAHARLEERVNQRTTELASANEELRRENGDRQRAEAALQQRADELAALNLLGRAVNATLSLEQTAAAGLEGMWNAARPDLAFLFLREGDRLILRGVLPPSGRGRLGVMPEHRVGECMCGLAVREGKPLYARDIFKDCRCTWEECKQAGLKSFAALPLSSGGEVMGVIGLASETERDFERQGEFLDTLANQVSIALTNARLYDATRQDLLERKQAEQDLKESRERLRSIFRAAPTGIGVVVERRLIEVNERVSEMTGYGRDELVGSSSRVLYPTDEEFQYVGREKYRQIAERGTGTVETRWRRKDGSIIEVLLSSSPIDPSDLSRGMTFTALDITEHKRAEAGREKLQAQLAQAQKMESVGRLAGGVAHDFNNMLQAILGNVSLALLDLPPDSPVCEYLEEVQKSARRSADLTRQLLAFARKQTIAPKVLDLNDTVVGMLKMLRRLIGEDIDMAWQPGVDLWPIKVDPSQIDQILANLCVNARDAIANTGKVTIETVNATLDAAYVQSHPECVPGDYVMLAVSDTGHGMDEATRAHLFEPFFTTKELGKGTGLGLATVFGIVKQNLGLISVDSEPGQGTTFKICLPRAEAEAPAAAPAGRKPTPRGTETVLLVEDEKQVLVLAQRILQQRGYTVLAARTPEAALRLAGEHSGAIHLLITDVVMPGMNGRELRNQLAALKPGMRCLYMSGYTADVIAHHGVLDEGVQFLQKPFTIESLAERVREALQQPLESQDKPHG